jgi:hypothetical protein
LGADYFALIANFYPQSDDATPKLKALKDNLLILGG